MRRVLVTGSKGFIGQALVKRLQSENSVVEYDIDDGDDVRDFDKLLSKAHGCEVIFHLAGTLGTGELNDWDGSVTAVDTNVIGTLNALEVAKQIGAKFRFVSKPLVWLNTYTITKTAAESYCKLFAKDKGLEVLVFRPFNVYGPGQRLTTYRKAVPHMIVEALRGDPITIYGTGKNTVDLVYIDDVVETMVRSEHLIGDIDIGSGSETTVKEMAETIRRLTGSESPIQHIPMRSGETEPTRLCANTDKMRELGIENGELDPLMLKTIQHYAKVIS